MVDPSLAISRKTSPGWPSSYRPTVRNPSWPLIENLWVIACRSSGNRRREMPAAALAATSASRSSPASFVVDSGCERLQPSR